MESMAAPKLPSDWHVFDPELIADTVSSRIWKVRRVDGSFAIVKALKDFDDVYDELRGAFLLDWRDGAGLVRLLGRQGTTMLLEYADGPLLSAELDARGDGHATAIALEVMAELHAPSARPVPPELQPLRERFHELFARARSGPVTATAPGGGRPDLDAARTSGECDPDALYRVAADIADRLLGDQRDVRPLHGDLHHDNILHSARGWLAIDPKGVLGDPCFDAANLFYNPLDRTGLCLDPERIAGLAAACARTLRRDERTVLEHAFVYGCLSAAWHAEDANTVDEERELSVASAIHAVGAGL